HVTGVQTCALPIYDLERDRMFVADELFSLQLADSVLGAEAAAVLRNEIMHRAMDPRGEREEFGGISADRLAQVEVQIAVAEMPVRQDAAVRRDRLEQPSRLVDEARQFARRHRDIVLDAGTFLSLRFRNRLAHSPEVFTLGFILRE